MGRKKGDDRVLGPYKDKARETWFLQLIVDGIRTKSEEYPSQAEAAKAKLGAERELAAALETTIEQGIHLYRDAHLIAVKKNEPESLNTTMWRLYQMFPEDVRRLPLKALNGPSGERLTQECRAGRWRTIKGKVKPECVWDGISTRKLARTKEPASVTSQLEILDAARAFCRWLVAKGHCKTNAMAWYDPHLEPEKEKGSIGRADLTWTHASRVLLLAQALAVSQAGTDIGIRAACVFIAMVTGLRATTLTRIKVRDIERRSGAAWILWAWRAKKRGKKERRRIDLAAEFEPVLGPLVEGRFGEDWLFAVTSPRHKQSATGKHWRDWVRRSVAKLCILASGPVATAHQLRGVLATELTAQGFPDIAQWVLDHARQATTRGYASIASQGLGEQRKMLRAMKGGKRP